MTQLSKETITCRCGREVEFNYYNSVNIDVDPELKKKIRERKINFFKCTFCGYKQELVGRFLYHDMENQLLIWVLPEYERHETQSIKTIPNALDNVMKKLGLKQQIVFGYDELFKLLK